MGSFQYLRLYIWPAPGNTSDSHMARLVSGRHVVQSRLVRSGFWGVVETVPDTTGLSVGNESATLSILPVETCPTCSWAHVPDAASSNAATRHNRDTVPFTTRILVFQFVENIHDAFQFSLVGKGNADFALAFGGTGHLNLRVEKAREVLFQ